MAAKSLIAEAWLTSPLPATGSLAAGPLQRIVGKVSQSPGAARRNLRDSR